VRLVHCFTFSSSASPTPPHPPSRLHHFTMWLPAKSRQFCSISRSSNGKLSVPRTKKTLPVLQPAAPKQKTKPIQLQRICNGRCDIEGRKQPFAIDRRCAKVCIAFRSCVVAHLHGLVMLASAFIDFFGQEASFLSKITVPS
jgi:hypothetical protein